MNARRTTTWIFGSTILISAFLLFQVQPIISKAILPWFGGTPAVWTTCMLFFQLLLFLGYCYAHLLARLTVKRQAAVHVLLLVTAVLLLPITPQVDWKPNSETLPALHILSLLLVHVGLPYFLLSSTGPLVQSWFSRATDGQSPYRLYALSNVGSLAALISYPFVFEPSLSTTGQARFWSLGFGLFVLSCVTAMVHLWRRAPQGSHLPASSGAQRHESHDNQRHPWFSWLSLPALASVLLLSTTNHVCQDVAVIPFLWIAPLSLYLITFIISFDKERWYARRAFGFVAAGLIVVISGINLSGVIPGLVAETALYLATMFCLCMICHGELVRRKPAAEHLTLFYLLVSAGGALGGVLVAVICPYVFDSFAEMNLALVVGFAISICVAVQSGDKAISPRPSIAMGLIGVCLLVVLRGQFVVVLGAGHLAERNFYGVIRTAEDRSDDPAKQGRFMMHGRICHGFQFHDPSKQQVPTMYYAHRSGVGIALDNFPRRGPIRVAAIGLGTGTIAAYGQPGDLYRFYEINPVVERMARDQFSFLEASQADIEVVIGDARISMERSAPGNFDVVVLDAFSGDAIPAHLMTSEAFALYQRHLNEDGVIACNISNRHLDLERVLIPIAKANGMRYVNVLADRDEQLYRSASHWFLMTKNGQFLSSDAVTSAARDEHGTYAHLPLWTDQYNNLFRILK